MRARGDFTADQRLILISAIALIIGAICAVVAVVLLKLIGFFTNLFFYQHLSFAFISPAKNHLGAGVILVPVVGGLIVGLMARYGSDRIQIGRASCRERVELSGGGGAVNVRQERRVY